MNRYKQNIDSKSPQSTEEEARIQSNKITISFPSSQVHAYDEEDTTSPVTIYLYAPSKKSVKIEVSPKIPMSDIKKIAEDKIGVKADHQLLYLSGKNVTQYGYVRLMNNNIIHILDSDDVCGRNEQIQLKVTILNFLQGTYNQNTKIAKQYKVLAKDSIQEFSQLLQKDVRNQFEGWKPSSKLYLLESSRLLEKDKSFIDQDITRRAQIICVITENQMKTRFSNDTKEEILHDISELLGFEEKTEEKPEPPLTEQRTIRPRFKPKEPRKVYPIQEPKEEEEDPYGLLAAKSLHASVNLPNFKKKPTSIQKTMSFQDEPKKLATKLKSSKSKKDLEKMLNSQEKQKFIFESPETIKEAPKGEREDADELPSQEAKEAEKKKAPQIPKAMPLKERRQIRMQIQKLFDLGEEPKSIKSEVIDAKEQISPISPPTSTNPVPKPKDNMRMSLGARPLFLEQLRANYGKEQG